MGRKIDEKTRIRTLTFKLRIHRQPLNNIYYSLKEGVLNITCPLDTDFSLDNTQSILRSIFESTLRYEAKRYLPLRLKELADQHGFSFSSVHIHKCRTRWGSCSSRGIINLSLSVLLLPIRLVDYVLLHELCHTKEMNHSVNFWALMDKVTNGNAEKLRKELKQRKILL